MKAVVMHQYAGPEVLKFDAAEKGGIGKILLVA